MSSYSVDINIVDETEEDKQEFKYFSVNVDGSCTITRKPEEEKPLINIWNLRYDVAPVGSGADPHHLSVEIEITNNNGLVLVLCFNDISKRENYSTIKYFKNGWAGIIKKGEFQWVMFDGRYYEFSYQPEHPGLSFHCKIPKLDLQPLVCEINAYFECDVYPL